jgi:predicted Zn-dependent peptidase
MMSYATISETDVDAERHVVLEEINIHHDTPEELVHTDFAALLLGEHPLAREILGDAETIAAMSRDRVHAYYEAYYRPANLTVAVAGNVTHDAVVGLVEELNRSGGERPDRVAPEQFAEHAVAVRSRPTEQAHVVVGVPGLTRDDDRRFTLLVLNELVGGSMSSRLFQEIREQRGLAYSTYSYHSAYADAGWFGCYAGTSPGRVDELLKVLGGELDRIAETVDTEEVERAKGGVGGGVVLGLEDTVSRMTRLGKMVCTGAEPVTIDEALARIEAVDVDAVRELAETLFTRPRCLAVVGPYDETDADRFRSFLG